MDLSLAGFVVSALIGILAWVVGERAYRAAVRGNELNARGIAADWLKDLRAWASEAVDVLAEATYASATGEKAPKAMSPDVVLCCRSRLSALIDRGRFLLPNQREREHGAHKPTAYQGLRHPGLDALVAAERILGGDADLHDFPDQKSALVAVRREFVSTIQSILDPRATNRTVARVLQHAEEGRQGDPTMGGLLPDPLAIPPGAEGILTHAARRGWRSPPVKRLPNEEL